MRVRSSEYMIWAKTRSHARFNLATSGVMHYPLASLPVTLADLEISGPSFYGYEPLQEALAAKCGVPPECLVAATGTSGANHLAMAAILEAGDEVVIEHPAYELMEAAARSLDAEVKSFPRLAERGYALDPAAVERVITPRTRLIVVTNLHNPSGAMADEAALKEIGALARGAGALVMVDEVYLDAAFERAPRSAFHLGPEFIVTSSLTKVYGLSGLRCGWILAQPELAQRMWRLNDLYGNIPAHAAERLSVIALENLPKIAARSRALLDANRAVITRFFDGREDLQVFRPESGTVYFPKILRGTVHDLCTRLREKYETAVVPGMFFGMPAHIRIGIGGETALLEEGLDRLGRALDEQE